MMTSFHVPVDDVTVRYLGLAAKVHDRSRVLGHDHRPGQWRSRMVHEPQQWLEPSMASHGQRCALLAISKLGGIAGFDELLASIKTKASRRESLRSAKRFKQSLPRTSEPAAVTIDVFLPTMRASTSDRHASVAAGATVQRQGPLCHLAGPKTDELLSARRARMHGPCHKGRFLEKGYQVVDYR
jgi:hypothetical protein